MALKTMISPDPYYSHNHLKKKRRRSSSPRRSRSGKSNRHSSAPDIPRRYPHENKIKRSSRHSSPQRSTSRHRKHKRASPSRKKVMSIGYYKMKIPTDLSK